MYIEKQVHNGYNAYLTTPGRDEGTMMDVGLLVLDAGQSWSCDEPEKELAALLLQGKVIYRWVGEAQEACRPDSFHSDPWCLHVPRGVAVTVEALEASELYIQATSNARAFAPKFYQPQDTMVQHAGANGELMGCMRREIKTLFDYESAPHSNMVLGEVLNFPGKWSSYPPHHHPQPEVYFHRFDHPQGFGASFANGRVHKSAHNGMTVINEGFHSQTAAPGYAMMYVWGIRHLKGAPWKKTRIDDPEHAWLWKPDANDHIFQLKEDTNG